MKPRFARVGEPMLLSRSVEWWFDDRIVKRKALLQFVLSTREMRAFRKTRRGLTENETLLEGLKAALPPEELAWAIAQSITRT